MREFRLCSKSHNAQYTSTKIKAIPVRTDTAMQEMLANSFLERPTVVRLYQRRGRYIKTQILQQQFNREGTL